MRIRRIISAISCILSILLITACEYAPPVDHGSADSTYTPEPKAIEITDNIRAIQNRGYVSIAVNDNISDFGYFDEQNGTYSGCEIRLAYRLAARLFETDYDHAVSEDRVHFISVPKHDYDYDYILSSGQADYIIAGYAHTEPRAAYVRFSDCYYTDSLAIMINKGENIRSAADLDGVSVGVLENSTAKSGLINYLLTNYPNTNAKIHEYTDYSSLSSALSSGKTDAVCADNSILKSYRANDRFILADRFAPQHYCIAAPMNSEGLIETANLVIAECEYSDIFDFK